MIQRFFRGHACLLNRWFLFSTAHYNNLGSFKKQKLNLGPSVIIPVTWEEEVGGSWSEGKK
jgi:hypothetical protein